MKNEASGGHDGEGRSDDAGREGMAGRSDDAGREGMAGRSDDAGRMGSGAQFGGITMSYPRFSGEGKFSRFLSDFQSFSSLHKWDDETRLKFLPLCLSGVARDAYDSLTDDQRKSYDLIVKGLSSLFEKPSALDAHAKLRQLRFDPHESLDVFVIKFRKLVQDAFPGSDSDMLRLNCFVAALPEPYQVDVVSKGIDSFPAAVERVRNMMRGENLRSHPVRQVADDQPSVLQQILTRLEQLERRVAAAHPAPVPEPTGATRSPGATRFGPADGRARNPIRTCFVCGSPGHVAASCRLRNRACFSCGEVGHLARVCKADRSENWPGVSARGPGAGGPSRIGRGQ